MNKRKCFWITFTRCGLLLRVFIISLLFIHDHLPGIEAKSNKGDARAVIVPPFYSSLPTYISVLDSLGLFPKEVLEFGLRFTFLTPSFDEIWHLALQVLYDDRVDLANEFDRIWFGLYLPKDLVKEPYVKTFIGSTLKLKRINNHTVLAGRYLINIHNFTISYNAIISYETTIEPK